MNDWEEHCRRACEHIQPPSQDASGGNEPEYAGRCCGTSKAQDEWYCSREFGHDVPCAVYYVPKFPGRIVEWVEVTVRRGITETASHLSDSARHSLEVCDWYNPPMVSYWKAWWGGQ